jgi:hypothetical protein
LAADQIPHCQEEEGRKASELEVKFSLELETLNSLEVLGLGDVTFFFFFFSRFPFFLTM